MPVATDTTEDENTFAPIFEAIGRESIVDPNGKVVKGFPLNFMPQSYGDALLDKDIGVITDYIKSLQ